MSEVQWSPAPSRGASSARQGLGVASSLDLTLYSLKEPQLLPSISVRSLTALVSKGLRLARSCPTQPQLLRKDNSAADNMQLAKGVKRAT